MRSKSIKSLLMRLLHHTHHPTVIGVKNFSTILLNKLNSIKCKRVKELKIDTLLSQLIFKLNTK